jgi:hypothetical protein
VSIRKDIDPISAEVSIDVDESNTLDTRHPFGVEGWSATNLYEN